MLLALLYQVVRYLTDLALVSTQSSWGYRRIQGEVLKLGFKISHMGVAKILRRQRIPPAPRRAGHRTWREFVRQHAAQMLACDFFTVETVWLLRLHVLFFIELANRKVHLAGVTELPGAYITIENRKPTLAQIARPARGRQCSVDDGNRTPRDKPLRALRVLYHRGRFNFLNGTPCSHRAGRAS